MRRWYRGKLFEEGSEYLEKEFAEKPDCLLLHFPGGVSQSTFRALLGFLGLTVLTGGCVHWWIEEGFDRAGRRKALRKRTRGILTSSGKAVFVDRPERFEDVIVIIGLHDGGGGAASERPDSDGALTELVGKRINRRAARACDMLVHDDHLTPK